MKKNIGLIAVCIWIGFIGAISFMEAWLKFRAPGVTLPIGLGIGRLVFSALNKMEWAALLTAGIALFQIRLLLSTTKRFLIAAAVILIIQTIWLLPALDARAELYITGAPVAQSNVHIYYVVAEGLKMIALCGTAVTLIRTKD